MKKYLLLFTYLLFLFPQLYANSAVKLQDRNKSRTLIVGLKIDPPFVMKDSEGAYYGLSIDLWSRLADQLFLNYQFKEYDHVPAVMLALSREQIDIAINPMPVSGTRIRRLNVTHPFLTSSMGVAILNDENNQIQLFFSNLFSWGFIKLMILLIGIVFTFGTIVWFVEKKYNHTDFRDGIHGILDGLWWSTVTITTVGYGDKTPKTVLGRAISMIWMFVAISLISSFTATITSKLTVDQLGLRVSTLSDLKSIGKIGVVSHSGSEDYLVSHHIDIYKSYDTPEDGLKALKSGEIKVFAHNKPVIRYLIDTKKWGESLKILPVTFNKHYFSLLMPKKRSSKLYQRLNPELSDWINKEAWNRILRKYNMSDH